MKTFIIAAGEALVVIALFAVVIAPFIVLDALTASQSPSSVVALGK